MGSRAACICLIAVGLSACEGHPGDTGINVTDSTGILPPTRIRNSFAVNEDQVSGALNLSGVIYPMSRANGRFTVSVPDIPVNTDVSASIDYTERLSDGRDLLLSRSNAIELNVGNADLSLTIPENRFGFDFDIDNDGITNITEREQGTDPFVGDAAPNRNVFVFFSIPAAIINQSIIQPLLIVSDSPERIIDNQGVYDGSTFVSSTIDVVIDVRMQVFVQGSQLILAQAVRREPAGTTDLSVTISDQEYNFQLDADSDGVSNYEEFLQGTDPFTSN